MSSPPDSLYDIEDAASKKRGRAQSVEPTPAPKDVEVEDDKIPSVSAPKKTKRDDECLSRNSSMSTIRKNMKDMSTTDKTVERLDDSMAEDSQERTEGDNDHYMVKEESSDTQSSDQNRDSKGGSPASDVDSHHSVTAEPEIAENKNGIDSSIKTNVFAQFGSKNKNQNGDADDDWSEFADDNVEDNEQSKDDNVSSACNTTTVSCANNASNSPSTDKSQQQQQEEKPKYTFGSTSGFGTKGWASAHQTTPTTQKPSAFTSLSGSGFSSYTPSSTSGFSSPSTNKSASAFGAFAGAPTSSPFTFGVSSGTNALSSLPKVTASALSPGGSASSVTSSERPEKDDGGDQQEDEAESETAVEAEHMFGEGNKIKVPGVKPTEVKTGEEDEDTIYQTKAKLLVLDSTTNNWKERGAGTFRINVKEMEVAGKMTSQARLVMRADSVYRLILNLLLFAEMKVFIMQDRFVRFAGFESETKEDGTSETKLVNYALKVANPSAAQELYYQIVSQIPSKSK